MAFLGEKNMSRLLRAYKNMFILAGGTWLKPNLPLTMSPNPRKYTKMATVVALTHPGSGLSKKGFYGYSWTTLFFGTFPALFRGDFVTFLGGFAVLAVIGIFTLGAGTIIAMFIWSFFYNKYYTRKLLESGYHLNPNDPNFIEAKQKLGVS